MSPLLNLTAAQATGPTTGTTTALPPSWVTYASVSADQGGSKRHCLGRFMVLRSAQQPIHPDMPELSIKHPMCLTPASLSLCFLPLQYTFAVVPEGGGPPLVFASSTVTKPLTGLTPATKVRTAAYVLHLALVGQRCPRLTDVSYKNSACSTL